jgi:hypothetical protein
MTVSSWVGIDGHTWAHSSFAFTMIQRALPGLIGLLFITLVYGVCEGFFFLLFLSLSVFSIHILKLEYMT